MYDSFSLAYIRSYEALGEIATQNYGRAALLDRRAERCRAVAQTVETRRSVLVERHLPVMALHNETVWKGHAASVNRERLRRFTDTPLYMIGRDLEMTVHALLEEAKSLTQRAAVIRQRARAADAAAASLRDVGAADAE